MTTKIEEVIVKIWDMSQASSEDVVRQATLEWAREELNKLFPEPKPSGRLLTDDCHVDGLREKIIPDWELKYTHEQNELRIVCEAQRNLTAKFQTARIEALFSSMRRFWAKVEVCPNGCWEWCGATNGRGYGQFWNGERAMPAHRFLYELFVKKIEDGLEPDHLCRNQKCVNPSHLEAVTHRENLRRGTGRQYWLNKTHCKHGHPFNEENTYTRPGTTWRDCRICHRRWSRERRLREGLATTNKEKDNEKTK